MSYYLSTLQEQALYLQNSVLISREFYEKELEKLLETNLVIVVEGQRRVGKSSVIISYLKQKSISFDKVFYFSKDLDNALLINNQVNLEEAFQEFQQSKGDPEYIVIDEIQDIDGWEHFIRKYYALKKYKIIITGSNSKLLSGELATYLTGRFVSLQVFPLSYKEFLTFKEYEPGEQSFREYIEFGGMPEIVFIDRIDTKKNFLKNLINSIILKDIVARYKVRDVNLLEKVLAFIANTTGSLLSARNIAGTLANDLKENIVSKTIVNYLTYFEVPYIINEVQRYDLNGKKMLEYVSKYYFTDIGIRNSFGYEYARDIGKTLENLVYNKLRQEGYQVSIGINKGLEIDFVAEKNGEKSYYQVCYLLATPEVIEREFGNLEKIKDNYRKFVLSMDNSFGNTHNGIEYLNIVDWLLSDIS